MDFAAHEMGMGTATAQSQILAERLGIGLECVRVEYGDSPYADSFLAGGSSQSASKGASVIAAHDELLKQLLKLPGKGSLLAGLAVDEVGKPECPSF